VKKKKRDLGLPGTKRTNQERVKKKKNPIICTQGGEEKEKKPHQREEDQNQAFKEPEQLDTNVRGEEGGRT